jgi:transcriptional regulator with XRE-family HTH domain
VKTTPLLERIAETLRTLREAAGFSQAQMAERVGVTREAYWAWENPKKTIKGKQRGISLVDASAFADVLGVSLDVVAGREELSGTFLKDVAIRVAEHQIEDATARLERLRAERNGPPI